MFVVVVACVLVSPFQMRWAAGGRVSTHPFPPLASQHITTYQSTYQPRLTGHLLFAFLSPRHQHDNKSHISHINLVSYAILLLLLLLLFLPSIFFIFFCNLAHAIISRSLPPLSHLSPSHLFHPHRIASNPPNLGDRYTVAYKGCLYTQYMYYCSSGWANVTYIAVFILFYFFNIYVYICSSPSHLFRRNLYRTATPWRTTKGASLYIGITAVRGGLM